MIARNYIHKLLNCSIVNHLIRSSSSPSLKKEGNTKMKHKKKEKEKKPTKMFLENYLCYIYT